jgi:uncharacterized protein (TIGR03083 family)
VTDTHIDYPQALVEENRLLTEAVAGTDWSAKVPTCPEWTLLQLIRHVGRGDRWAAQIVRERAAAAVDPRTVPNGRPPDDREGTLAWLQEGPRVLLDAVAKTPADASVWTFIGPKPASWWIRRRLHECAVHRADAVITAGQEYTVEPVAAADAITEWLELAAGMQPSVFGTDACVVVQPQDAELRGTSWRLADAGRKVNGGSDQATVDGTASSLLLAITRRRTAEEAGVRIAGNRALWDRWLAATPF